jgi:hypothetical protein
MALDYQANHGISSLKKCIHCGLIWAKIEGCPMTTFNFENGNLQITRSPVITKLSERKTLRGIGCGNPLNWNSMIPVKVPDEFQVIATVNTDDKLLW